MQRRKSDLLGKVLLEEKFVAFLLTYRKIDEIFEVCTESIQYWFSIHLHPSHTEILQGPCNYSHHMAREEKTHPKNTKNLISLFLSQIIH